MRISDWSSDVCSSDLLSVLPPRALAICRKALINSNLRAELQDSPSFEARFLSCRINCQSGAWRTQSNFGLLRTATVARSGYPGWPNALSATATCEANEVVISGGGTWGSSSADRKSVV